METERIAFEESMTIIFVNWTQRRFFQFLLFSFVPFHPPEDNLTIDHGLIKPISSDNNGGLYTMTLIIVILLLPWRPKDNSRYFILE